MVRCGCDGDLVECFREAPGAERKHGELCCGLRFGGGVAGIKASARWRTSANVGGACVFC